LLITIRQRQLRFVGHIIREESIEKLSFEGRVEGCRSRGKQTRFSSRSGDGGRNEFSGGTTASTRQKWF